MFITDTIPGYKQDLHTDKENNWICIEDLCSSYCEALGGDTLNICAWWNKESKLIHFGGQWAKDCNPVYSEKEPTDTKIWEYTKNSWVNKRMAAHGRRNKEREEKWAELEKVQKEKGISFIYVILEKDGVQTKIKQPVGQRTTLEALPLVGGNLTDKNSKYFGSKIKFLRTKRLFGDSWTETKDREWDWDASAAKSTKKHKSLDS